MPKSQSNIDKDKLLRYLENGPEEDLHAMNDAEREMLRALMELKQAGDIRQWESIDVEEDWQQLRHRLEAAGEDWTTPQKLTIYKMWRYAAVAAVLLLFAGAGWYYLQQSSKRPGAIALLKTSQAPQDITLITGDGTKVTLDTLKKIQEGNGSSMTASKDELVYDKDGTETQQVIYNTLIIPRGYTYKLVLSDGTKVWLNAETQLRYPTVFPKDSREVTVAGEAYFEVAADASRTFLVNSDDVQVKVLGTAFNINTYDNVTSTTLVQGRVAVDNGKNTTYLRPSQQMVCKAPYDQMEVKTVDTDIYTAWKDGDFVFDESTLEDICRRLERAYNYKIVLPEGQIRYRKLEANLPQYKDVNSITQLLEKLTDVHFEINQRDRVIVGTLIKH